MKVAFLTSTGRTGTKFFGERMNRFDTVLALHEPEPQMKVESTRYLRWKNKTFPSADPRNVLPLHLFYRYKFRLDRLLKMTGSGKQWYFEANPNLISVLPEVKKAFPRSCLIQVVRHPVSFIRSALGRGWFLHINRNNRPVHPLYTGDMTADQWTQLNPVERACWYWLECNRRILDESPDLVLTFESIFSSPHDGFAQVLSLLSLPQIDARAFFQRKINPSFNLSLPPYEQWEPDWKKTVEPCVTWFRERVGEKRQSSRFGV